MTTVNKVRVNFVRRTIPRRGPFSTEDYNASMEELAVDLADFGARWNTEVYPVLNTLPRGSIDTDGGGRWVGASSMPDAIDGGLDGDHMFVDNAASTTQDDGLFWDSTNSRPKTIRESSRDIDDRLTSIYTELSESLLDISNGLSSDQWDRLGGWVKDSSTDLVTSVSYKARTGWTYLNELILDVFTLSTSRGVLGTSGYTIQAMLTDLLAIHGGTWNTDTSSIDHSAITGVLQASVAASATYTKRARGYSPDADDLPDDLNRIRYEIARTRLGAATTETTGQWNADITDPVGSGVACLKAHIEYAGNGTQDANNPHGIHRQDVDGLDTEIGYNNTFTGKTALGSESPTYSSSVYVSGSLEAAIGDLDAALDITDTALAAHEADTTNPHSVTALQAGAAVREVYDFSGNTDFTTPIVISHNKGAAGIPDSTFPLIQVIDTAVGGDEGVIIDEAYVYEQEHGIVTSDAFVSIEYIDANTFHVYTNVTTGKIIAVF